ncbi:hypothetical protein CBR_g74696 [Chara braunii]|uniref:Endonuclease/exonuclease/phosphatase domain-containing protein n=1 Tax=Chara braunii TaxID=69332 RepID=A0A388KAC2_CHABU|nr:hypothetical protein CBR_g74696 [Chara braunii]|eukprot:GBG67012.1 hypothetical protein CBR_g74696 [Chara braunii]
MTIYAPSDPRERRSFLEELPAVVPVADNLILVGDFNTVLTPGLDSQEVAPRKTDATLLANFMAVRSLVDTFRTMHLGEPGYTWFSSHTTADHQSPKRRLDLILAAGAAWDALTEVEQVIESMSDYRPVTASFRLADQLLRGPGTYRLNTEMLKDPNILQWVEEHWNSWRGAGWSEVAGHWLLTGCKALASREWRGTGCVSAARRWLLAGGEALATVSGGALVTCDWRGVGLW